MKNQNKILNEPSKRNKLKSQKLINEALSDSKLTIDKTES